MFSVINDSNTKAFPNENKKPREYVCLSTDSKPTTGIANGSICLEMNTGKVYAFNEAGSTWLEI